MSKLILRGIENVELSICIPAYNRVDTLKEAIDSVLNLQQNGIIYNCIISEDNSGGVRSSNCFIESIIDDNTSFIASYIKSDVTVLSQGSPVIMFLPNTLHIS